MESLSHNDEIITNHNCVFRGCSYNSNAQSHLNFFQFPFDFERLILWLKLCNRLDLLSKGTEFLCEKAKICDSHFEDSMFIDSSSRDLLHNYAFPSMKKRIEVQNHNRPIELAKRTSLTVIELPRLPDDLVSPKKTFEIDDPKAEVNSTSAEPGSFIMDFVPDGDQDHKNEFKYNRFYNPPSRSVIPRFTRLSKIIKKKQRIDSADKPVISKRKIQLFQGDINEFEFTPDQVVSIIKRYLSPKSRQLAQMLFRMQSCTEI